MALRRKPFEPGLRNRSVRIDQLTQSVDSAGAPAESWTTLVARMPAARGDIQGREAFVANQESARYDTRWEIGYREDCDPDQVDVASNRRLVEFSRVYDIVSGSVIGNREGIEFLTLARVG